MRMYPYGSGIMGAYLSFLNQRICKLNTKNGTGCAKNVQLNKNLDGMLCVHK